MSEKVPSIFLDRPDSPWVLGNTTTRRNRNLDIHLQAFLEMEGKVHGAIESQNFGTLLKQKGAIGKGSARSETGNDGPLGRRSRQNLEELGLVSMLADKLENMEVSFPPQVVTPLGHELISSNTPSEYSKALLRSLVGTFRVNQKGEVYRPLGIVLSVLGELEGRGYPGQITPLEMAAFVTMHHNENLGSIAGVVDSILAYREDRESMQNPEWGPLFDEELVTNTKENIGLRTTATLLDYTKVSLKYLDATGLFVLDSEGLRVSNEHIDLAHAIGIQMQADQPKEVGEAYTRLIQGPTLPTIERNYLLAPSQASRPLVFDLPTQTYRESRKEETPESRKARYATICEKLGGEGERERKVTPVTRMTIDRSVLARNAVLERAGEQCENPQCPGMPLDVDKFGRALLQVDHVEGVQQNDHPECMIAVCPNCHAIKTLGARAVEWTELYRETALKLHQAWMETPSTSQQLVREL